MKTHETARDEQQLETKVPESLTAPAAIEAATKAIKQLERRRDRTPAH